MSRFMGWWRSFFSAATDAPAVYGEASGLMVLSTLALGYRKVNVGQGVRPNLFMLLSGESTVARKTTSVRFARQAVESIAPELVAPRDYTMEGLYKWMQVKDENTGRGKSKFCLFSEEFGSDLARAAAYGGMMREDLCGLYDGDDFTKVRAKGDNFTIHSPRVNMMGGVAYHLLTKYCSQDDWYIGFLMRFLFVTPVMQGTADAGSLQPKFPKAAWDFAINQAAALYESWKNNPMSLDLTPAAQYEYAQFMRYLPVDKQDNIMPVYMGRLGPNILKLALLYQLDVDPMSNIQVDAMRNACNFVSYCLWPSFLKAYEVSTAREFESAWRVVSNLAKTPGGVETKTIWEKFVGKPGLPGQLLNILRTSTMYERFLTANGTEGWRLKV